MQIIVTVEPGATAAEEASSSKEQIDEVLRFGFVMKLKQEEMDFWSGITIVEGNRRFVS